MFKSLARLLAKTWSQLALQKQRLQGWSWLSGCCGVLIGTGGFNEFSVAGMGAWALLQFDRKKFVAGPPTFRDLTAVSIGALMLAYWQFQDPYLPSTDSGLTLVEAGKAIIWSIFSLIFFRCSQQKSQQSLLVGISAGLFAYAGATAVGSLICQGPGGGYGNIYNIYDGTNLAGSVICGYAASGGLLIISRLRSDLFVPAALVTAAVGLQSGARTPILILICLVLYFLAAGLLANSANWVAKVKLLLLVLSGIVASVFGRPFSMPAISRFSRVTMGEGRTLIYPLGFQRLTKALVHNDPSILGDPTSFAPEQWWHNILLDSYRNFGVAGLALATLWAMNLVASTVRGLASADYLMALVSLLAQFLLLTGLPLGTGAHELISVLALTLLCNMKLTETRL